MVLIKGGLSESAFGAPCVGLSLRVYSQPPAPFPEARELGSSAQSADTGAQCRANTLEEETQREHNKEGSAVKLSSGMMGLLHTQTCRSCA